MKLKIPLIKIKRKNTFTVSLLFVLLFCENLAGLLPARTEMIGPLKFSDIGLLCAVIWSFLVFLRCGFKNDKKKFIWPALYIFIWLFSSQAALSFFGQSMFLSFIRNRTLLAAILLSYAVTKALRKKLIDLNDLLVILFWVCFFELFVYYLQYLTASFFKFTSFDIDERYGSPRVRVAYLLVLIVGYLAYNKFLNNDKYKKFYLFIFALSILVVAVICKHRTPTMIIIATLGLSYILWKKNISKKIIIGFLILVIVVPIVFKLPMVQDVIKTASSTDGNVNSLIIRNKAKEYYLLKLQSSLLVGFGEPYESCKAACDAAGNLYGFIREDNGVIGFLYSHGILGVLWLIGFWIAIIKRSIIVFKRKGNYFYILYFAYETLNIYMGMHWYYDYPYPFMIAISLLVYEYLNVK